jgi:DNA invertase Pin-like site-specific DNA recombinase
MESKKYLQIKIKETELNLIKLKYQQQKISNFIRRKEYINFCTKDLDKLQKAVKLREEGNTLEEIGKQLNVNKSTVSRWLNNKHIPNTKTKYFLQEYTKSNNFVESSSIN